MCNIYTLEALQGFQKLLKAVFESCINELLLWKGAWKIINSFFQQVTV